jgi:hypothetical protein
MWLEITARETGTMFLGICVSVDCLLDGFCACEFTTTTKNLQLIFHKKQLTWPYLTG